MVPRLRFLPELLVCLFLLPGCQSVTTDPTTPTDYEYFPLETGRYIIYDVEEDNYALNTAPVHRVYQLKEVIGAGYTDVTGQPAYRLLRYRRATESHPWQADSVWSVRFFSKEAIRTENGKDFVKLLVPLTEQLTWNGNQRNGFEQDMYEVRNVGQLYRVQGKQFDKTVIVIGQNDSTLISQNKHMDVYAQQVGLIYKERTNVQFCLSSPACTGHNQIDYGIQQIYRIRAYGNE